MRLTGAVLLGLLLAPVGARAADPNALWKIVHDKCVPHEQDNHNPSPCALVDLTGGVEKGFVVLKDIRGVAQFLLIPTARIGGIEDPAILGEHATNYWAAAWDARKFVDERLHTTLPRDAIALAINSSVGRTQNELHIHVDCIRPDVRATLAANLEQVTTDWKPFPVPLAGHRYRAIRINEPTLNTVNPFRLLAEKGVPPHASIGMHTLVLVGETFGDGTKGFVLLDDQADLAAGDRASGEQLEDHACTVAAPT